MPHPLATMRNLTGNLLGYASCRLCGRTWMKAQMADFHFISLPSTRKQSGSRSGSTELGLTPMCEVCWQARTPEERWMAFRDGLVLRPDNLSDAAIADVHRHIFRE
jgi:hypothetical protein